LYAKADIEAADFVPCGSDDPGAVWDLRRIRTDTRWDRKEKRFFRRALSGDEFWRLIEDAKRESGRDRNRQIELLAEMLSNLTFEEISAFREIFGIVAEPLEADVRLCVRRYSLNGEKAKGPYGSTQRPYGWTRDLVGWIIAQGKKIYELSCFEDRRKYFIRSAKPVITGFEAMYTVADLAFRLKAAKAPDEHIIPITATRKLTIHELPTTGDPA
jgi:hypothetical protein